VSGVSARKKFVARDLCLIHGEADPRVSTLRVAEALHPSNRERTRRVDAVSQFIKRNRRELERYGNIPRHKVYSGKRGQPAFEDLLNEDQVTIVCMRSDSKEAEDARFEIIQLIRAYRRGEIAKSEITIITDLFTAERPTIERGDENVVHVRHERLPEDPDEELDECKLRHLRKSNERNERKARQGKFDLGDNNPLDSLNAETQRFADAISDMAHAVHYDGNTDADDDDVQDMPEAPQGELRRETWQETHEKFEYDVTLRYVNEAPWFMRIAPATFAEGEMVRVFLRHLLLIVEKSVPREVIENALARLPGGSPDPGAVEHLFKD
jgi:hypothetical protein